MNAYIMTINTEIIEINYMISNKINPFWLVIFDEWSYDILT